MLGSAVSLLFVAGLASRLRDKAPTRAAALLYLTVIGLAGFALVSLIYWLAGARLAGVAAQDQVAAGHAWTAVVAVARSTEALGNGFVGAGMVIAGWAITATGELSAGIGWVGIVGGLITLILVFAPTAAVLFLLSIILTIVFLAWAGLELRKV